MTPYQEYLQLERDILSGPPPIRAAEFIQEKLGYKVTVEANIDSLSFKIDLGEGKHSESLWLRDEREGEVWLLGWLEAYFSLKGEVDAD